MNLTNTKLITVYLFLKKILKMSSSIIITIIYVIGIIIGALGFGMWDAETSISKAMLALAWTIIFLIGIFLTEKKIK